MRKFKKLMESYRTQNKACLHNLYTEKQIYYSSVSSSNQPVEDEKIFDYRTVSFQFTGTGFQIIRNGNLLPRLSESGRVYEYIAFK